MAVRTEKLDGRGSVFILPQHAEFSVGFGELRPQDLGIRTARFGYRLIVGVGHAKLHPAAGAFGSAARLIGMATDPMPIGTEKLDQGPTH